MESQSVGSGGPLTVDPQVLTSVGPDSTTATQPEFMTWGKLVNLSEPQPLHLLTTVPASQEAGRLHPLMCINHTGQYLAYDVYNDSCYLSS